MVWPQTDQSAGCFVKYEGIETQSTQNTCGIDVFGTPHGPAVNRGSPSSADPLSRVYYAC